MSGKTLFFIVMCAHSIEVRYLGNLNLGLVHVSTFQVPKIPIIFPDYSDR